ncbi:hypothetical protein [uncultured Rhodospira sp.]|uniref:hypothetical protein n=1 Tax=uncultured Rhodospira sp. TaxID=1936189 RepID=UPI00262FB327|nr:hypothetical protein [uncultured Rhodospira sp.]
MSSDKPTLKPPPALGSRPLASQRTAPDTPVKASPASAGAPRLSIGVAGAAPQQGSASAPAGPTPPSLSLAKPGGASPAGTAATTPAAAPPPPGQPTQARRPRRPRRATDPQASRPRKPLEPGRSVRDLRPPKGTVRSNATVAEVLRAAQALTEVLVEENTALRSHNVEAVKALADRKNACTQLYRKRMLAIHRDPGHMTNLPEDEREIVRAMGVWMDAHLSENVRLLKSTMEATNRLMTVIVDAMRDVNGEAAAAYNAGGRMAESSHNPARVTLSFNENL